MVGSSRSGEQLRPARATLFVAHWLDECTGFWVHWTQAAEQNGKAGRKKALPDARVIAVR